MKTIRLTIFLALIILVELTGQAQIVDFREAENLYDMMSIYSQSGNADLPDSTKGAINKEIERTFNLWAPRLYPSGDFSGSQTAIKEVAAQWLSKTTACNNNYENIEWGEIGPVGLPNGSNAASATGVGRIQRLEFDPEYNGTSNQTIYGSSEHGGLWRSENGGNYWEQVNTDLGIPFTSVSGIGIDPNNSNNLFISTGLADVSLNMPTGNNVVAANPIWTIGVYRSMDYGANWEPINNGLLDAFSNPGAIRNLKTHPDNGQKLYAATSEGFFKTANALATSPSWNNSSSGITDATELRGLCFKPDNANTIYTSGRDIYRSTNDGGNWLSMTGPGTGLDLEDLPDDFEVGRINIAVTPANAELLYAYIVGRFVSGTNIFTRAYVYKFDGTNWTEIENYYVPGTSNIVSDGWIAIDVSPVEEDFVVFGHTKLRGSRLSGDPFQEIVPVYNGQGFHPDVHDIKFSPVGTNPEIYIAHHGGVSKGEVGTTGLNFSYSFLYDGLGTSTIWTFDVSDGREEGIIIGTQDNGSTYLDDYAANWKQIGGGDGYTAAISDVFNPTVYYRTSSSMQIARRSMFPLSYGTLSPPTEIPYSLEYGIEAIVPKSFPNTHVSLTGKNYFGFSNVYERLKLEEPGDIWSDVWKYSSDVGLIPIFNDDGATWNSDWRHQLTVLEVSQRNPNIVVVAVGGVDMGPGNPPFVKPALLKSETGFNEGIHDPENPKFFDITPNLPTIPGTGLAPVITGVAIDPYDENHLWISFTGYYEDLKVWESFDGGDIWQNADPEGSLYNLPVNDIAVQNGTHNGAGESRIFIATDAGVYYKEPDQDCWMKYGLVPNVRVSQLKMKECENVIYAATYGRGVWKAELPAQFSDLSEIEITENTLWDSERFFTSSIRVKEGNRLTIQSELHMPAYGRIIVEKNAELIVDGGVITSGCGVFWQGIELWGTTDAPQAQVSGYRAQGYLQIKNGGVIEFARNGVTNWKKDDWDAIGGVIDVRDSEFRNCRRAVEFMKHQNVHPTTGNPLANISKFKETKFVVDDDYPGDHETDWPDAQVTLWGVDGVSFSGCEFIITSTVSTSEKRSKGIYSSDAHYRVQPACATTPSAETGCPTQDVIPTVFDGFYRGIEATKSQDALPILVSGTIFKNNMVGVELASLDFSEIIRSQFELGGHPHENDDMLLGEYRNHLGVYSNETRCFAIEENEFIKDPGTSWDERNGVLIFQSEANSNNVYRNAFGEMESAAIGYQVNRDDEYGIIGLQFNCNEMTDNFHDFVVTRDENEDNSSQSGIRTFQGSFSPTIAAGNTFSLPNGISNQFTHWAVNSLPNYHYYYSPGQSPDPDEITPDKVTLTQYQDNNACLTNYRPVGHKPIGGKGSVIQEYNQKKSDYYNLLYTYKQLIDDGDTDGTIDEIVATWPEDAWDLYDMLMARSPNNSETVLITAADREIMPHAMLLEVLLANPDALRNGQIIKHVENNLTNPMPSYMIDILHAASDQTTLRTTMESTLSNHHAAMSRNYNFIIQLYTTDTLNGVHNDSLLYYLGQMDSPTGKYNLAGRLLRVGENTAAMNIIDSIPHNYKLSDSQQDEWKAMQAFFNLLDDADRNDRNIASLDSTELAQMESIALDADGGMGALRARKALCFFYQHCIPGPALPKSMSTGNKKPLPPLEELLSELDKVSAFPNPAKDFITFSYSFFREQTPNRQLRVFNQNGALIQSFDLGKAREGQQLWDTRKTTPGIYLYDVYEGERKVHTGKVVIQ